MVKSVAVYFCLKDIVSLKENYTRKTILKADSYNLRILLAA